MAGKKKSGSSKLADNTSKGKTNSNQRSILDHFTKKSTPETPGLNDKVQVPEPDLNMSGLHVSLNTELLQSEKDNAPEEGHDPIALPHQENAAVIEPCSQSSTLLSSNETYNSEKHFEPPEPSSPDLIDLVDDLDDFPSQSAPSTLSVPGLGTKKENPIIIDSSPVKVKVNTLTRSTIDADSVSVKPIVKLKPAPKSAPKQLYSIFTPRPRSAVVSAPVSTPIEPAAVIKGVSEAPYPDQMSQHVQGPQTKHASRYTSLPHRKRAPHAENGTSPSLKSVLSVDEDDTSRSYTTQEFSVHPSSSLSAKIAHLASIPAEHQQSHPAIAHVVEAACNESTNNVASNKLWTEKWRPTRASHVLGNEHHAEYLRQWLCALEVQLDTAPTADASPQPDRKAKGKVKEKRGKKRARIVRAVIKKPGRKKRRVDSDEEDDWIVHSDDSLEEEEPVPSGGDDDEYLDRPTRLYRRFSHVHGHSTTSSCGHDTIHNHTFNERLTNTILLAGSHGCGKTAAVYACAEELGWEVFEVYPGIGKRSGANLENLVGEVGRNHLVRKAQLWDRESETKATGDSSLNSFPRSKHLGGFKHDNWQSASSAGFGFVKQSDCQTVEGDSEPRLTVRQSLILLEEVDVLFREDANFWPAVINLIKDCKRPVILTCNDVSLVPVADLPLQEILEFETGPVDVATSFLQAVCCAENYLVERSSLSRLYEDSSSSEYDRSPDLRRTLHYLQMWCPVKAEEERTVPHYQDESDLEDLMHWRWPLPGTKSSDASNHSFHGRYSIGNSESSHAELISFADCYLMRKWMDTPETDEIKQSEDDILGHPTLHSAGSPSNRECMGYHDRDWLIVSSAIGISRGGLESPPRYSRSAMDTRAYFQARVQYEGLLKELRRNVAAVETQIARRPVFDLDYLPWMRLMIALDDKGSSEEQGRTGRMTRNSQRYIRTIEVSEKERELVDITALE